MRIGRTAVVTDTGRRRIGNEDAFVFKPPFFAIADGMGGARAGEIAAGLAAAALEEGAEPTSAEGIVALIDEANRQIWERSIQDPDTSGMGTTVTAALVAADPGKVVIGHVGDSRAYLYRDGTLAQLTTDHSLVVELVESGILTPEEAERHPQRSAITRAVGTEPTVEVDAFTVDAEPGVGEEPPIEAADHLEQEPTRSLRRHGAGPGGRVAAILLLLAVLGIGLLLLYWGFRR